MTEGQARRRVLIMGAAGRDFHNFNVVYRDDPAVEVVAFTAAQIPGIAGRSYPPELAGPLYPEGIPIAEEAELENLCRDRRVDQVVFAYSDVDHGTVMHAGSRALAAGADFALLGPARTMLAATKPVISVTAARTGCGKSQVSRWIAKRVRDRGIATVAIRHPMPYGDLARQRVQRFASLADLDAAACTNEEREEYTPHVAEGGVIFSGVDYAAILAEAEKEAEVIVWDGGNNDFSFIKPDLDIALVDALRPGQAARFHPGEAVVRGARVVVVNKVDAAPPEDVEAVIAEVRALNPAATLVRAASPVRLDDAAAVRGRSVLVIEDGPTITHGGLPHGAGFAAARAAGAVEIVDPRPWAAPAIRSVFHRHRHIGPVLPAVGYDAAQLEDLRRTIEGTPAEVVVIATPIDLGALIQISKPAVRARYDYADAGVPTLGHIVDDFLLDLPARLRAAGRLESRPS